jgi:hypothetical protein
MLAYLKHSLLIRQQKSKIALKHPLLFDNQTHY